MKEERLAILRMVAEGKITAAEAESLLEALSEEQEEVEQGHARSHRRGSRAPRPPRPPRPPRDFSEMGRFWEDFAQGMENFARGVAESVQENLVEAFEKEFNFFEQDFDPSPRELDVAPDTELVIKCNSGAITLFGTDEPKFKISGALQRHYKITQEGNQIAIRATRFGTDLTIHVPRTVTRLAVKSNLGEILARNFTATMQEMQLGTNTGNVALEMEPVSAGKIGLRSNTGNIKLMLSPQSACEIKASADRTGQIESGLPLDQRREGPGFLQGTLNGGGAEIRLATNTGTITIDPA